MKKTSTIPKALFQSPPSQRSEPDNLIHKRKQRYLSLGLLLIFTIFSHMGIGKDLTHGYETACAEYEDASCRNLEATMLAKPKCPPAKGLYHNNVTATTVTLGITDFVTCTGKYVSFQTYFVLANANGQVLNTFDGIIPGTYNGVLSLRIYNLSPSSDYTYWHEKSYFFDVKKKVGGVTQITRFHTVVKTPVKRFSTKFKRCHTPTDLTAFLVKDRSTPTGRTTQIDWKNGHNRKGYSVIEKTIIPQKGSSDPHITTLIKTDARHTKWIFHKAFNKVRIRIKNHCYGNDSYWSKAIVIGATAPLIRGIVRTPGGYVPVWNKEPGAVNGYRIIVKTRGTSFGQVVREVRAIDDRIFIPFSLMPKGPWTFMILGKSSPNRGWSGWSRRNFGVNGTGPLANGMESAGSSSLSANNASLAGNKTAIIYPNTNRGNFKIQFKDKYELVKSVTIFNMFGIQVFNKKYDSNLEEEEYNLGDQLNSGMYKVVIKTENGVEYKTLLVEQ